MQTEGYIKDIYTLSPMQEGILFHALLEENTPAYFEQMSFRLVGDLDIPLFKKSLNMLFERHDVLRTAFIYKDIKQPVQVVLKKREAEFLYEDKRETTSKEKKEQFVKEFKVMDKKRSFDLTQDVLLRVAILQLEEMEYEVVWSFHHILMDGWSTGILISEFFEIYYSLLENQAIRLADVIPYRMYIQWLQEQDKEKSKNYWNNYLEGYEEKAVIPGIKAFKTGESRYKKERVSISLDQGKTNQLAVRNQVSLNTVVQTAWGILLAKYNRKQDVVFGAVVSGRPPHIQGGEAMVGLFINTIPVRICYDEKTTSNRLLRQVQQRAVDSEPYHYYPLADIQAESLLKQNLIDHILVFENYPISQRIEGIMEEGNIEDKKSPEFSVANVDIFEQTNYDFVMIILPGNPLTIEFDYNGNVYDGEFVESLANHFNRVMEQILNNEDLYVDQFTLLSEAERRQVLVDFNRTCREYPADKTIHELFEEQAARAGDHISVVKGQWSVVRAGTNGRFIDISSISYKKLNEKSNHMARVLIDKGVKPGDVVGIMGERSIETVIGLLAILKAGGAYLPINPDYPQERIRYMLTDSAAKILLTSSGYIPEGTGKKGGLAPLYLPLNRQPQPEFSKVPLNLSSEKQPAASPGNLAYVIYTSGSTGRPKGVMIEHRNAVNVVCWFGRKYQLQFGVHVLQMSDYTFDPSVNQVFGTLLHGGVLHVADKELLFHYDALRRYIKKHHIHILYFVPLMLKELLGSEEKLESVRVVLSGGEKLDETVKDSIIEKGYILYNQYGPTETAIDALVARCTEGKVTLGTPISNTRCYIVDKNSKLSPLGVPGELIIGGAGIGRGYLNNPELTAEKFDRDFQDYQDEEEKKKEIDKSPLTSLPLYPSTSLYRTGDLARWLPDGNIEFLERLDYQVKIRGNRIELGEIESRLLKHKDVKNAAVTARSDEIGSKYLCAYIVPGGEDGAAKAPDIPELKKYLSHSLPDYMIPSYFMHIETIPLTFNGKVDRKALPDPVVKKGEGHVAPRDDVEKKLVEIWSEVLGIEEKIIGIDSNFFELGGHSLKAIILVSMIHKEFNVKLPLAEIFKIQTIRKLSTYIEYADEIKYARIESAEEKEYYALSSAQKRLYFLQQMDLNSTSYNIPMVLPLGKGVGKNRLESTIKKLIERHESLRTSFKKVNEVPIQKVYKPHDVDFSIEYFDMTPLPHAPCPMPHASIIERFVRPFDLSQAPLIRSGLIKLPDGNHIWMVDVHHIVSDGTSHTILADDFISLYNGEELEPLRLQYKDFSQWQNNLFETGRIKDQEEYWLNLYKDTQDIPRLNLPNDYPRPTVFTFKGDYYHFMMEREDAEKFKALGARNGGTLYMNILAALNTLFYKYTGQTDIIIGSGIAGRHHANLQHIIGMFVNTLAMRNYPRGEETYESFLKEVMANCLKAFENQEVQFEELVDKLDLERDTSRNPLFDISMVVQNFRQPGQKAADTHLLSTDYKNPTAKFDLTFYLHEIQDDIYIKIEHYTGIFKPETIRRLAVHFKNVVKAVVKEPSIKLKDIEIISKAEKNQLLYEFNHTFKEYPANKTIHQLFREQAEKTPDNIALIGQIPNSKSQIPNHAACGTYKEGAFGGTISITYKELDKKANQLANYLFFKMGKKGKHTFQEKLVGIFMDKTIDLIAVVLGILKSGAAYVPLDTTSPEKRLETIINDAGIEVVISQKKYIKTLNRLQWECPCFHTYLCIDSYNIRWEEEEIGELMSEKLWNYIGETAVDDITAGGWVSSYTGQPMSRQEMKEYGDNILEKLEPLLHAQMRVLEIGCASGISMYRIAPKVHLYYGIDLSTVIIEKNKKRIQQEQHQNIKLSCLPAHEIDKIKEQEKEKFDLIIMNSVIQCFPGHNYLGKVIHKIIGLVGEKGYLFIGDVMDQEKKNELIREMTAFKYSEANRNKGYTTKTDFSSELFLSRDYWKDLEVEFKEIVSVRFSNKKYTIENELTRFRYDVLIKIDKQSVSWEQWEKQKYQEDLNDLSGFKAEHLPLQACAGSLAYIIYTSGTTGGPKGVMVNHYSVVNLVQSQQGYFGIHEKDRILQFSSICFDASVEQVFMALFKGAALVLPDKKTLLDYNRLTGFISNQSITHIHAVPTFLQNLQLEDNHPVKRIIAGGEVCPVPLARRLSRYCDFYNEYGPTETTVTSIEMQFLRGNIDEPLPRLPIGKPIGNTQVYLLDRGMKLVPRGVIGELYIGGVGTARGYLNRPELTFERFVSNSSRSYRSYKSYIYQKLYRTGDLARWLPDANIEFIGRIDQQVKLRGFRIELGEIESLLLKHRLIKNAVVIDSKASNGETHLCAYIILTDSAKTGNMPKFKNYLSKSLPDYMIPTYFVEVDNIPVTPNGKLDRKALPAPNATTGENETYAAPRNRLEKKLVKIWGDVLNISHTSIGIDDNFFHLGGHSLKVTVLAAKIHKELNVKLPLAEIFNSQTIRKLSTYIEHAGENKYVSIEPAQKKEYYPLSSIQKRMYIAWQMEIESISYNMPIIVRLKGELEYQRLKDVFKHIIKRHEILRTSFIMMEGGPVQKIHGDVDFEFDCSSTEDKSSSAPCAVRPASIIKSFIRPFDLSRAPLLRVGLIKENEGQYILMVDMHHIISDGVSFEVLTRELRMLYNGEKFPSLRIQYKDFSEWQNGLFRSGKINKQKEYWLKRFDDYIPVLNMPTDSPRPSKRRIDDGDDIDFIIEKELSAKVFDLVEKTGTTLYMVLLTVYNILLFKYTKDEDIVVGTPVAGRRHADLENVIGAFINMLPMRNCPRGDKTFKDFLEEVKETVLEAFENQDYQYEELVMALKLQGNAARNPLFDTEFVVITMDVPVVKMQRLTLEPYPREVKFAKFDLHFQATEAGDIIHILVRYSTALFKKSTIEKIKGYYMEILQQVVEIMNIKLQDIKVSHRRLAVKSKRPVDKTSDFLL